MVTTNMCISRFFFNFREVGVQDSAGLDDPKNYTYIKEWMDGMGFTAEEFGF